MKYVYIEAHDEKTPEYVFLRTFLEYYGIDSVTIVPINGKDNLKNLQSKMMQNQLEGDAVCVLFDADETANGGGYAVRREVINKTLEQMGIRDVDLFLWPNNQDDGDFEMMLEHIVKRGEHSLFFDCFGDYEKCVASKYKTPNRKSKFHTFISSQKDLNKKQRDKLGSGNWLFDDSRFWNIDSNYLEVLKDFLMK